MDVSRIILNEIQKRREASKTTKADIKRIIAAKQSGDYSEVHKSSLYNKHSGEYCALLEVMEKEYRAMERLNQSYGRFS